MTSVPLAAVSFLMNLVMGIWILVAVLVILVVLIQKGRGGGIGAAFGGGGAGSLLGTKTGDFLTWVTIALVAVFLFLGLVMVKFYKPAPSSALEEVTPTTTVPASAPASTDAPGQTPTTNPGTDTPAPVEPGSPSAGGDGS